MRKSIFWCVAIGLAYLGCGGTTDDNGGTGEVLLDVGESCLEGGGTCMEGLVCSGAEDTYGTCQYAGLPGTKLANEPCVASWECAVGLACASDGVCKAEGEPGTTAANGACEATPDCQILLTCMDGVCQGFQPSFWVGESCVEPDPEGTPLKVYFDIGRTGGDFYRLPFPSDMSVVDGHIDLTGHPNPGLLIDALGNPVDAYFDMIQNDADGFGTMSYAYFRFNRWPDGDSMKNMENIYIVNLSPESEEYGEMASSGFRADSARGQYICQNWVAVGPSPVTGRPLRPKTTYAAVLTTGIKDANGNAVAPDADFPAMLDDTAPSGAALEKAWNSFAPFRKYLSDKGIDPGTIAAATVFTTGDPAAKFVKVREKVQKEADPVAVLNPADESNAAYTLISGTVTVPFYQSGTRPFKKVADGGDIKYDADGLPVLVETEAVKFALTVPKGTAPAAGWPIVIFAHGTGGSETSFVSDLAAPMAGYGAAVIGLEQVQHGGRRGLSEADAALELNKPEYLVYNYLNPRAARDNAIQAAADHFQLVRFIENFQSITGQAIAFDMNKLYFFGHSQGSQGPFIAAVHEPKIKAIIESGAGGYLLESLLGKKKPFDVTTLVKLALMDPTVDKYHPLLNLVQLAFDEVDPANHGKYVYAESYPGQTYPGRHMFMSYGLSDSFTPEATQTALAKACGLKLWAIPGHELEFFMTIDALPYTEADWITRAVVQYEPVEGSDGHYVIFENPDAIKQSHEFIHTLITDGVPTVVAP